MIFQCSWIVVDSGLILDSSLLTLHYLTQWGGRTERRKWKNSWVEFNMWRKDKEKSKGNHSWPPTGRPIATTPTAQKKSAFQLLFQTLYVMEYPCWPVCVRCAGCVLSKLVAHWGRAEQEKEGPDIVHALLSNHQNCCVTSTSSHTQNLGGSEGSYLHPSQTLYCQMYMKAQRPTFMS